jgi:uncharacterized protein YrrD
VRDPVAWNVIERGWDVVDARGAKLGHVEEVRGDPEADIFDGVVVTEGLFKATRYVPSERVGPIYEGEAHLAVDKEAFDRLPPPA